MARSAGRTGSRWRRIARQIIDEAVDCARCRRPLDKALRWPDPWSPTAGHIVALCEGGAPRDPANLQAEHLTCNIRAENDRRKQRKLKASRDW